MVYRYKDAYVGCSAKGLGGPKCGGYRMVSFCPDWLYLASEVSFFFILDVQTNYHSFLGSRSCYTWGNGGVIQSEPFLLKQHKGGMIKGKLSELFCL